MGVTKDQAEAACRAILSGDELGEMLYFLEHELDEALLRSSRLSDGDHPVTVGYLKRAKKAPRPPAAPLASYANARQHFINLLHQGGISSPRTEVLDVVESRCAVRMQVCSRVTMAVNLYRDVRLFPGASTQRHLLTQHGLHVNGPMFSNPAEGPACLLSAANKGQAVVVKMLPGPPLPDSDPLSPDWQQQLAPAHTEAIAVRDLLRDKPDGVALVETTLVCIDLTQQHSSTGRVPGRYCALVMPQYVTTVAKLLHTPPQKVLVQGMRMREALQFIHSRGYVHMDVKADNIFLDMAGAWWLADFGSAVKKGQPIHSTTHWFAPSKALIGRPAEYCYDWHMLAVALVCELLHKEQWKELLLLDGHTPMSKLVTVVQQLRELEPELRAFLQDLLTRAQPEPATATAEPHAAPGSL
eukprot:CAMPEP_0202868806 /NCGR_PEP_ID=MMETSP1391-20130828/11090_1 /ASSEMBLY_ACC=CAM_ASM_000867 /TAXON_ID=1034604 /ORGANISM="Chlamydomonas leiostraca, Strain SAG 11-49" /LENGTH=412 /DNA_ID=CAMNT_0049549015 /DNA_START=115 /DNA_END=1353 /DNA_ORIENTATION=+